MRSVSGESQSEKLGIRLGAADFGDAAKVARRAFARGCASETECSAELKGSIGEGPNHSNHSNHSNSFKTGIVPRKFKKN